MLTHFFGCEQLIKVDDMIGRSFFGVRQLCCRSASHACALHIGHSTLRVLIVESH